MSQDGRSAPSPRTYLARGLEGRITEALRDTPVVCLLGPRQSGKSTLVSRLAPTRQMVSLDDEKEKIRREAIRERGTSVERFLAGLCAKSRLLDYVENFILFHKETQKIIAQNHQFLGVNRGFEKFLRRKEFKGKLGVFWHTQGSGKSFSMIFYARKIFRKCAGNFSFVVVTDREDLDRQIYQNFLSTNTVRKADAAQPKDSGQMRKFLGENKRLVFTLIHKFRGVGWC